MTSLVHNPASLDLPDAMRNRENTRSVQMNIRIERELKDKGDRAFENYRITPSRAVRALWTYASSHEDTIESIIEEMEGKSSPSAADIEQEEAKRLIRLAQIEARRDALFTTFYDAIDGNRTPDTFPKISFSTMNAHELRDVLVEWERAAQTSTAEAE